MLIGSFHLMYSLPAKGVIPNDRILAKEFVSNTGIQISGNDLTSICWTTTKLCIQITEELKSCFANGPNGLRKAFEKLTDGDRKAYLDWIYTAKTEETKAKRIVQMMEDLQK